MATINPYLIFNGNCREAMTFYLDCIGGELMLQTVEESLMAEQWPAGVQKHILHASLVNNNITLLASDMTGSQGLVKGNNIVLALHCKPDEEIKSHFAKLSQGGTVVHQLHRFFDGTIGSLVDKYGIHWFFKS